MPTATDSQRNLMYDWFGDHICDSGPLIFLFSHGFFIDNGGMIHPPVSAHNVSYDEWSCIDFLCNEWDYGYA